jgi:hypothetical protein
MGERFSPPRPGYVVRMGLLIFAQGRAEHETGGALPGIAIIAGVLVLIALGAFVLMKVMARRSAASKGGVQPPRDETGQAHPGSPPHESVEPRS